MKMQIIRYILILLIIRCIIKIFNKEKEKELNGYLEKIINFFKMRKKRTHFTKQKSKKEKELLFTENVIKKYLDPKFPGSFSGIDDTWQFDLVDMQNLANLMINIDICLQLLMCFLNMLGLFLLKLNLQMIYYKLFHQLLNKEENQIKFNQTKVFL